MTTDELGGILEYADGDLRLRGHRVSFFLIVEASMEGATAEVLAERYPTVPPRQLREALAFCERYPDVVRAYHACREAEIEATRARFPIEKGPSIEELRRRRGRQATKEE